MANYAKLGTACLLLFLASCQSQDVQNVKENIETSALKIEASIVNNETSRASSSVGKTSFEDGESIGLFAFDEESVTKWTYADGSWTAEAEMNWPSKTTEYTFYAFYPYTESAELTNVSMPDLTTQDGTFADEYDFIVATNTCSFSDTSDGTVSFTGENAFQHVYSMLTMTFTNNTGEDLTLGTTTVNLEGIMTQLHYNFENEAAESDSDGSTLSEITFTSDESISSDGTLSLEFLTNAVTYEDESDGGVLSITVVYSYDDTTSCTASAEASITTLLAGTHYTLNLSITKGGVTISGYEIDGWEDGGELDSVTMVEEES